MTSAKPCRLFVGTCGYSYPEWVDAGFYPRSGTPAQLLRWYAAHFPATELNHTWYRLPQAEAIERQRRGVPPEFLFAAKLTRSLTHEVDPRGWRGQALAFRQGLAPLLSSTQLVAVLLQLPHRFDYSAAHRSHLATLLDELEGLPLAVEFRHAAWATERVFAELERRHVALVAVDEPPLPELFPALNVVTNPELIYVRFHGRNCRGWASRNKAQQFDYNYSREELALWIETRLAPMARQAQRGFLFFNNTVAAQAPRNATLLAELLREQGYSVARAAGAIDPTCAADAVDPAR